jgi:hypothetical protein
MPGPLVHWLSWLHGTHWFALLHTGVLPLQSLLVTHWTH